MILVYCAKDKQQAAVKALDLSGKPYEFVSPTTSGVNYSATKVYVVGSHPSIVEKYRGITHVEVLELKPETED